MTTPTLKLTATCAALCCSSLAGAHTGHHGAASVYHYLMNPDHIAVFALLGVTALGFTVWLSRKTRNAANKTH